jgi:hypothetical protein
VPKLTLRARKELAKLTFCAVVLVGVVQGWLLSAGVGDSPAVRFGLGVPLTVALVFAVVCWAVLARRDRDHGSEKSTRANPTSLR